MKYTVHSNTYNKTVNLAGEGISLSLTWDTIQSIGIFYQKMCKMEDIYNYADDHDMVISALQQNELLLHYEEYVEAYSSYDDAMTALFHDYYKSEFVVGLNSEGCCCDCCEPVFREKDLVTIKCHGFSETTCRLAQIAGKGIWVEQEDGETYFRPYGNFAISKLK